ncbi:MAG TPA: sodium/glutamate symporter [Blastocatellia bacterium]|nr:sodium/glutamate symporter [Blastocatellia bacterium]
MELPINLKLDIIQSLALASLVLMLGTWVKRRMTMLDRLNIPAAVVGGLLCSLLLLTLRGRVLNLEADTTLRDLFMIAFFTTIGFGASLQLLRIGGVQVLLYFGLATVVAVAQNAIGIGIAQAFGLHPLLGIIAGSVSLAGGPATSLAFGPTFEQLGVAGATTLGLASATFGITLGGLIGGPVGTHLIHRHRLLAAPSSRKAPAFDPILEVPSANELKDEVAALSEEGAERSEVLHSILLIALAMGIGTVISQWFNAHRIVLPAYIGAMLVAALLRNLDDRFKFVRLLPSQIEAIGNISLSIFIAMALMNLRLWELVRLALPLVVILVAQVILVLLVSYTISFYLMGRDYDSAVMAGGFVGFMLGTTANAMACMDALVQKFGPAPRAYLVVPIVGAFLIDFTNALIITTMSNLFQ